MSSLAAVVAEQMMAAAVVPGDFVLARACLLLPELIIQLPLVLVETMPHKARMAATVAIPYSARLPLPAAVVVVSEATQIHLLAA